VTTKSTSRPVPVAAVFFAAKEAIAAARADAGFHDKVHLVSSATPERMAYKIQLVQKVSVASKSLSAF